MKSCRMISSGMVITINSVALPNKVVTSVSVVIDKVKKVRFHLPFGPFGCIELHAKYSDRPSDSSGQCKDLFGVGCNIISTTSCIIPH